MRDALGGPQIFDAAVIREGLAYPEFHDGRRVVVGQLLSIHQFWRHLAWWQAATPGVPDEWAVGLRALLNDVFPPSRLDRLLKRSVADVVAGLPGKAQYEAAERFFGCLVSAHMNVTALLTETTKTTTETIGRSPDGHSAT